MTEGDREALEELSARFTHTAAIARLVKAHTNDLPGDIYDALGGIAETLSELTERMDAIIDRPGGAA